MKSIKDNLSFEHYIDLKDSYTYHITLLCRYEQNGNKYKLIDFTKNRQSFTAQIANVILCQIRFFKCYKKVLIGLSMVLFLSILYFCEQLLLIFGIITFMAMFWYLLVLITDIDIKNHEIFVFEFINENNKVQGEKCFRSLTKYDEDSKIDFLISLTGHKTLSCVENPDFYTEILSLIKEYAETNCPFMKAIMAFDSIDETKFIRLI